MAGDSPSKCLRLAVATGSWGLTDSKLSDGGEEKPAKKDRTCTPPFAGARC